MKANSQGNKRKQKELFVFFGLIVLVPIIAVMAVYIGHYVILLLILIFLFFFIIRKPLLFLKIFFVLGPLIWTYSDAFYIPISVIRISTPIIIGGLIVLLYFRFLFFPIEHKTILTIRNLILLLILFSFPAIFWSRSIIYGLGEYIRLISPFIIMFSMYHLVQTEDQANSVLKFMGFVTISTFITLLLGYIRGDIYSTVGGFIRLSGSGIFFQPFAKFITVNIQIIFILFTIQKNRKNPFLLIQLALLLIILFLTYHRTSWVIFITSTLLGLFLFNQKKIFWLLSSGLLMSIFLFWEQIYQLFIRYIPDFNRGELDIITSGRTNIWRLYFSNYLNSHPINIVFGMGFGDPNRITIAYFGTYLWPHSDYLAFLVETGIVPLVLYTLILVFLFLLALKNINTNIKGLSSILSKHTIIIVIILLIAGTVGAFYGNIMSSWYLYAIFGIFLASIKKSKFKITQ